MFGGDPFGNSFEQMQRHMQQMDNMMNQMMGDPFGNMIGPMMGGPMMGGRNPMLMNGGHRNNPADMMLSPFGGGMFGGLMQQMGGLQHSAMNDPNSTVITQSTMISYDGSGQPRVVQSSTRKAGDVKETRHSVQNNEEHKLSVGHSIGDRTHIIEKKRDRDGRVRQQQKFINLDEDEAEDFNHEFKSRATRNLTNKFGHSHNSVRGRQQQAIEAAPSSSKVSRRNAESAPIITVPDDDEEEYAPSKRRNVIKGNRFPDVQVVEDDDDDVVYSNHKNGPTIREISDEEADMSIPKRRKGLLGKFFGSNNN